MTPTDEERLAFARDARLLAMRADGLHRGWLAYDLRYAADAEETAVRREEARAERKASRECGAQAVAREVPALASEATPPVP